MRAATTVTAEQGLRGLTHRAVDREAGLSRAAARRTTGPAQALQEGLAAYVASTAAGDVAALTEEIRGCGPDDDRKVEQTSRMFLRWLPERDVLLARLELELAATRDPRLAAVLRQWRAAPGRTGGGDRRGPRPRRADGAGRGPGRAADGILLGGAAAPGARPAGVRDRVPAPTHGALADDGEPVG